MLGIELDRTFPCVGRASDVKGYVYSTEEFDEAVADGAKLFLLNLKDPLTDSEIAYVKSGADMQLPARFLLANRKPWYSMEQRNAAPIWAAVFGRGDLRFVYNAAVVRNLTNFHCIYPNSPNPILHRALTLCLNSKMVRESSKLHGRVYGGGLNKFEPNDLKSIHVPDLRVVPIALLEKMSSMLDEFYLRGDEHLFIKSIDAICHEAAHIAHIG